LIVFFSAHASTIRAYQIGPISLVNIVGSIQPFFAMLWAFLFWKISPRFAPKELLTVQSVQIKCIGFTVVIIGLLLLSMK